MPFNPQPAPWVPFRDTEAIARVKAIPRERYTEHANPDFRITVMPDDQIGPRFVADMVGEIVRARDEGRRCVLVLPNPNPAYRLVARQLNELRVDCKHVTTFNMDEWADQDGNVADESYPQSFIRSTKKFWFAELDPELRMPESQVVCPTTETIGHYGDLIEEAGGADACYTGPGWPGHLAFVDPGVPEWSTDLDEFLTQGARVATLHPLTIAQNSLHGCFGFSGDIASVPPKGATIGPLEVSRARRRVETHALTTAGTQVTWQRMVSRLSLHGPVTPQVPTSIMQRLGAEVYVSESLAAPIEPDFEFQY